jgi:hypothetical protein
MIATSGFTLVADYARNVPPNATTQARRSLIGCSLKKELFKAMMLN